ncbi:MAG: aminopeptidase P family N-terminal domain-containing protein, partial [Oscillospiraceae bacterium]
MQDVKTIYRRRTARAQALMREAGIDLLLLAPSSNLRYLTGLSSKPDERLQLCLLPA